VIIKKIYISIGVIIFAVAAVACVLFYSTIINFLISAISNAEVNVGYICDSNSDCGSDGFSGDLFCQENSIYKNYITYVCENPSTNISSCSSSTTAQLQTPCSGNQTCTDGACVSSTSGAGGNAYYPTVLNPVNPVENIISEELTENPMSSEVVTANNIINNNQIVAKTAIDFSPLTIASLSQKIPEFGKILFNLGVEDTSNTLNLENYDIFLPGINSIKEIPTDVVFVSAGNQKIDALTKLNFLEDAPMLQEVNVLQNKRITLIVKPSSLPQKVFGYVFFESTTSGNNKQKFSVLNFEYSDIGDGIYEANINSPAVVGEYQIITSLKYESEKKDIGITTLVDPEGYIYEKVRNQELRIGDAIVSLYKLNDKNEYELWSAADYGQENPQITKSTGNYSYLVPEGSYYLEVSAPGYYVFKSDVFSVSEGKEIHSNIMLEKKFSWSYFVDLNLFITAILFCLVAYNFYRDWKKDKKG
jgi:hypothetical protein